MLQLLIKLVDIFIALKFGGNIDEDYEKNGTFRPFVAWKEVKGERYRFKKSCYAREKYANCNNPNSSNPIILELNKDIKRTI